MKTKADLAWNDIRSTVLAVSNLRAKIARERALNRILPELQDEFEAALSRGQLLELGPGHLTKIEEVLAEELDGAVA